MAQRDASPRVGVGVRATLEYGAIKKLSTRAVKNVLKESFKVRAEYWAKEYRDRHFEPSAMQRYRYAPRSAKWNKQKAKVWGQAIPLVWKGDSRDAVKQGRAVATYHSGRYTMPAKKLNYTPKNSKVRMADELRTTLIYEERELDRVQQRVVVEGINRLMNSK